MRSFGKGSLPYIKKLPFVIRDIEEIAHYNENTQTFKGSRGPKVLKEFDISK